MNKFKKHMPLFAIIILYSIIALYNLGSTKAPQTYIVLSDTLSAEIDLGDDVYVSSLKFYLGARELSSENNLTLTLNNSAGDEVYRHTAEQGSVFCWSEIDGIDRNARYICFETNGSVYLSETAVSDGDELIVPMRFPSELFDEQSTVPDRISYLNGTYFDEIYHARTAYEFLHGLTVYEWTHPPLGKVFISLGIKLFGMTPFGWRIIGTLFGIAMIPVIYAFLTRMFKDKTLSICGTLLFTFDFMHFAQSRIATIDVYVTFFIMLMYFFMYKYYDCDASENRKPLVPCGIAVGFAVACKWTGVYAAAGLAILFFAAFFRIKKKDGGICTKSSAKTIVLCICTFVLTPLAIYALSYIPFVRSNGGDISSVFGNQIDMLTYHGKTVVSATHSFSSPWYSWPADIRPIWYYTGENGGTVENISAFGNPAVWWAGIPAVLYCVYDAVKNKDKNALFLSVAYFAQLIPWIPVTRITFIYHYFPCVPFLVLMICHSAKRLNLKKSAIALTAVSILLFAAFYPVISGFPVPNEYITKFLRWLPTWQLTI